MVAVGLWTCMCVAAQKRGAFCLLDAKELGFGGRVNGGWVGAEVVDTGQFILRGAKIRLHRESVPERGDR